MKSQNYISLKILTLALLLLASCEVWAVNFGQSQTNPLLIQTQITVTNDNQYILDQDLMFKPAFSNLFNNDMLADPVNGKVYFLKNSRSLYHISSKKERNFCYAVFDFPSLQLKTFYTDTVTGNELIQTSWGYPRKCDTIISNGKGGGNWSSSETWQSGKIPNYGDEVIVSVGDEIILDEDVYLKYLHLNSISSLKVDSKSIRLVIDKDLIVNDSARIYSSEKGKINCSLRAEFDGTAEIKIANTAIVNFESLKILGKTYYTNGNINVSKFYTPSPSNFIVKDGVAMSIGEKKYVGLRNFIRQVK